MQSYSLIFKNTPIYIDHHPAEGDAKAAVLYFHGGGLIYGSRKDLPDEYIRGITAAGFHLFCCDYLLAPESPLRDIHQSADEVIRWFFENREELLGSRLPFVLFGRSAGGYLALSLAFRLVSKGAEAPAALLCFYGFNTLLHPGFIRPSPAYQRLPRIPDSALPRLEGLSPRSEGELSERYFIYAAARQRGSWPSLLSEGEGGALAEFSVPENRLAALPPAFIAASTGDEDVPYSFSEALADRIPESRLFTSHYPGHDFDRDPSLPESERLYREAIDWLRERFR